MSIFVPNMPIGARAGVLDRKHLRAMGASLPLFLWAVTRQTPHLPRPDGRGLVLYGRPLTIGRISREIRTPHATVRKWMRRQEEKGYLVREFNRDNSFTLFVCKAKKFNAGPTAAAEFRRAEELQQIPTIPQDTHKGVRPTLDGGCVQSWTEGTSNFGRSPVSNAQKSLDLSGALIKISGLKEYKDPPALAGAALSSSRDEKQEKPARTIADIAIEKSFPASRPKSPQEIERDRARQLEEFRNYCKKNGIAL